MGVRISAARSFNILLTLLLLLCIIIHATIRLSVRLHLTRLSLFYSATTYDTLHMYVRTHTVSPGPNLIRHCQTLTTNDDNRSTITKKCARIPWCVEK